MQYHFPRKVIISQKINKMDRKITLSEIIDLSDQEVITAVEVFESAKENFIIPSAKLSSQHMFTRNFQEIWGMQRKDSLLLLLNFSKTW